MLELLSFFSWNSKCDQKLSNQFHFFRVRINFFGHPMEIDDESVDIFWGGVSPGDHKWHFQGTQECQLNWHEIAVSRENCTRECILMTSIPSEMIRKISFPTLFAAGSIVRHFEEVQVPPVEQKNSLGYTASIGRDPLLN